MIKSLFFIFIGGGVGSVLRYLLSFGINKLISIQKGFPFATLGVNLLSCILMSLFIIYLYKIKIGDIHDMKLFLLVGLLGGFSTFSTFSYETYELLKSDQILLALTYILVSIIFSLFPFFLLLKNDFKIS